jgi:uncharacterized protein YndB with AHSA1/START domain
MSATTTPTREKPALEIERRYAAAPDKVWRAWTEPQAIRAWFGPGPQAEVSVAETDVRVGGRYRIVFATPDGESHDVSGVYREVAVNRRLAFTWAWKSTPERESLVTIALEPDGAGTLMRFRHEQFFDEAARDRHQQGWTRLFVSLERHLGAA